MGAYTKNNHKSNVFAIELLQGSDAVIEYEAPLENEKLAKLIITELNYAYRGVNQLFNSRDFGDSDYCQVNINCSPEGDSWQDEKAACRISIKAGFSYGWCSGSLINNTANNCTPMFLQQITVRLDKILMQVLMIIINGFFISTTKLQVVVILIQILAQIQFWL